jgi:hypothetical protein
MLQHPKFQLAEALNGAGVNVRTGTLVEYYLSTIVLSVWFSQLVSADSEAFNYNGHCLLLCLSLGYIKKLAVVHPKIVNITFLANG